MRTPRLTLVVSAISAVLIPTSARADMFGADIPVLSGILVQATDTVVKINEQIRTAKQSYEEIRRVAGYADEAAQAFKDFSNLNSKLFGGDLGGMLDQAFPDLSSIRAEASRAGGGGRWADGTGELRSLVSVCLTSGHCSQ